VSVMRLTAHGRGRWVEVRVGAQSVSAVHGGSVV
jgi:hypothetical protein